MGFMALLESNGRATRRARARAVSPMPQRAERPRQWTAGTRRHRIRFDQPEDAMTPALPQITYDDFLKVDVRVGMIIQVDDFPKAKKPAYKLRIDFGVLGVKTSSAQITKHYRKDELLDKLVLAVVNFRPRQISDFFSEVLTLGVMVGEGDVVLVQPDRDVPLGSRIL
jgi:tRNA-binding protein